MQRTQISVRQPEERQLLQMQGLPLTKLAELLYFWAIELALHVQVDVHRATMWAWYAFICGVKRTAGWYKTRKCKSAKVNKYKMRKSAMRKCLGVGKMRNCGMRKVKCGTDRTEQYRGMVCNLRNAENHYHSQN